jgi:hypothetical protein
MFELSYLSNNFRVAGLYYSDSIEIGLEAGLSFYYEGKEFIFNIVRIGGDELFSWFECLNKKHLVSLTEDILAININFFPFFFYAQDMEYHLQCDLWNLGFGF